MVSLAVLLLCGLLALSGYAGPGLVAATVALAGVVVAWGWPALVDLPAPGGTALVLVVAVLSATAATWLTRTDPFLRWVPAALAVSLLSLFGQQLARRDGRPRLVESLAGAVTGIAVVIGGASFVPIPSAVHGEVVLAVAAAALAAAALVELLGGRVRGARMALLAVLAGAAAAATVAASSGSAVRLPTAVLLGLVCGAVGHAFRSVLSPLPAMVATRSQLVSAAGSVLVSGVAVYVVARVLVG